MKRKVLDRLLQLAGRNGELSRTDPAAEVELLGKALADLAAERTAAHAAIGAAADEREKLLLQPGTDDRLEELDRTIERQQRTILRCDRIERLLLAQLRDRRDAFRQQHFDALAERYRTAVAEYCDTVRRALLLRGEIAAIRDAGDRAGFAEARLYFDIPTLMSCDVDHFEFATTSQLASVRPCVQPELTSIRFNRICGIYHNGDVAGFSEETAALYVNAGVAERVSP